jgi:hypothetical protein
VPESDVRDAIAVGRQAGWVESTRLLPNGAALEGNSCAVQEIRTTYVVDSSKPESLLKTGKFDYCIFRAETGGVLRPE